MTASAEARETALIAAQAAADKLATDVSIVDVSDRLAITDAFVLTSAPNERAALAIAELIAPVPPFWNPHARNAPSISPM